MNASSVTWSTTDTERAYAYLSSIRADVDFPIIAVTHPELPYVWIPVAVHPSCSIRESIEWNEIIGQRW